MPSGYVNEITIASAVLTLGISVAKSPGSSRPARMHGFVIRRIGELFSTLNLHTMSNQG